jgi:hypothetical protein
LDERESVVSSPKPSIHLQKLTGQPGHTRQVNSVANNKANKALSAINAICHGASAGGGGEYNAET